MGFTIRLIYLNLLAVMLHRLTRVLDFNDTIYVLSSEEKDCDMQYVGVLKHDLPKPIPI